MKTLTTFAVVAALIAGVGIANAQSAQGTQAAKPATAGTGKFCLTTKTGPKNCTFASMNACQAKAKGMKGTCTTKTSDATTGTK